MYIYILIILNCKITTLIHQHLSYVVQYTQYISYYKAKIANKITSYTFCACIALTRHLNLKNLNPTIHQLLDINTIL